MQVFEFGQIKTVDTDVARLMQVAHNVASSRATVLIVGARGTGKELIAKFIHSESARMAKEFVVLDCTNFLNINLEDLFVSAASGTLVLSEINELTLSSQSELLIFLSSKEFQKLNVRLVVTSSVELNLLIGKKKFREDLFYRLNVIPLKITKLADRPRDILFLAQNFVEISCLLNNKYQMRLDESARRKLLQWSWPGNTQELENVIERSVLLSDKSCLTDQDIHISGFENQNKLSSFAPGTTVHQAEKSLILKTLDYTEQNRTQAARLLGISIRTLRNKINEYRASGVSL